MDDERPTKKRLLSSIVLSGDGDESKSGSSSQKFLLIHQQQKIETLEAELDHQRSKFLAKEKQCRDVTRRMEQKLELEKTDAANERQQLEDRLSASERRMDQLALARDQAMQMNERLQYQLQEAEDQLMDATNAQDQHTVEILQEKLQAANKREEDYKNELNSLRHEMETRLQEISEAAEAEPQIQQRLMEQAPPEILTELSRSRIKLATEQRLNRNLQRQLDESKKRNVDLLGQIEGWKNKSAKFEHLAAERDAAVHDLNETMAELNAWKEFGINANIWIGRNSTGPPEVATILRFLESKKVSIEKLSKKNDSLLTRCEDLQSKLDKEQLTSRNLRAAVDDQQPKEAEWASRLADIQEQLNAASKQVELYKRENNSLQTLMKTFELQMKQKGSIESNQLNVSLQTLQVQLDSAESRSKEWQTSHETLSKRLAEDKKNEKTLKAELEHVKDKFEKLRDALMKEREKASDAEARAIEAEELAAKGSFNPSTTRVMHFMETPLEASLKKEVDVLKRQLGAKAAAGSAVYDPDKLHEGLKKQFKENIALFREGVYLITGFKIDMLNSTSEQPVFQLRSMLAEQEDDKLLFQWPKKKGKADQLNLMTTEFAKSLTRTSPYDYITKYNNVPAFVAAVQLSLFEKQTMMV